MREFSPGQLSWVAGRSPGEVTIFKSGLTSGLLLEGEDDMAKNIAVIHNVAEKCA